jgi:hypothetical protein
VEHATGIAARALPLTPERLFEAARGAAAPRQAAGGGDRA